MKSLPFFFLFLIPLILRCQQAKEGFVSYASPAKVRSAFLQMLQRPATDFKPAFKLIQTDSVLIEKGFFYSEAQEKVPVLIYKPVHSTLKSFPVVICLHGTGGSKDETSIRNLLYQFSTMGYMGVAIDARFHGERIPGGAHGSEEYVQAITSAWKNSDNHDHPFFYDTVYDLLRLIDYLQTRPDVQANRIGMMGISMGGIETWMAAAMDPRIKVVVPVIAAQSFLWSLNNNKWQGRARTIWNVHLQVARDLGDSMVNRENVNTFWNKLLPGITGPFDCPSMLRLISPRPLLLLNNELDPNCPLPGAKLAFQSAMESYHNKKADKKLKIDITPGEPHRFLPRHEQMAIVWFRQWL